MYRYNNPVHRILDALELLTEPGQTDQLLVEACNHLFSQLGEDFLKTIPKTNVQLFLRSERMAEY